MKRFAFFCVVALAFCACSDSAPKAEERFVAAYVEMRAAEQLYGGETPTARLVRREILNKYGYTREEFLKACDKVLENGTGWIPFQMAAKSPLHFLGLVYLHHREYAFSDQR